MLFFIKKYSIFLLFLSFFSCANQGKTEQKKALPITNNLGAEISMPVGEYIVEIFEDSKGNLWFGTVGQGAAKYDKKSKKLTYFDEQNGMADNVVVSIVEDAMGNLWFGTHHGVSKFDGKTFTNFLENEGIHGPGCNVVLDKKGMLWAGTNDGAFRFENGRFVPFEMPFPKIEKLSYKWVAGKIWNLKEDSKGNMWFARDGYGVCKFDGENFTLFTQKDGLCSNTVCGLAEDAEGNMWFGSLSSDFPKDEQQGGLSRYDGKTFTQFSTIKGLYENDIYGIHTDKKADIWISATGVGLYYFESKSNPAQSKNFTLFDETDRPDLIKNFAVQSFLETKDGKLWCGFSGGLFRFEGGSFRHIGQEGPW